LSKILRELGIAKELICIKLLSSSYKSPIPVEAFSAFDSVHELECDSFEPSRIYRPLAYKKDLDDLKRRATDSLGSDLRDIIFVTFAEYDMNHIGIMEEMKKRNARILKFEDSTATYISRWRQKHLSLKQKVYLKFSQMFTNLSLEIGYSNYLFVSDSDFYEFVINSEEYKTSHPSSMSVRHFFLDYAELLARFWKGIYHSVDYEKTSNQILVLPSDALYDELNIGKLVEVLKALQNCGFSLILKPHPQVSDSLVSSIKSRMSTEGVSACFAPKDIPGEVIVLDLSPKFVLSDFSTLAWNCRFLGTSSILLYWILRTKNGLERREIPEFFDSLPDCFTPRSTDELINVVETETDSKSNISASYDFQSIADLFRSIMST